MQALAEKYLPRYTVEDYVKWEGDWELIDGIAYALAPSPSAGHQNISGLIFRYISEQLESCSEGCKVFFELDWIVDEHTVVRPDVVVVCEKVEDFIKTTPEVIFEVVSPNTAQKDEKLKFCLYERERVPYYALVYQNLKKVRIFKLKEGKYEKVFEGERGTFRFDIKCPFEIDFDWVWQRF